MTSPFPGVDPYLEEHWGDIHTRLMVYISDQINEQLPNGLQARVEESVCVDLEELSRWIYPDVRVIEQPESTFAASAAVAVDVAEAVVAEPTIISLPSEQITERHIEIVDLKSGNRVVTAIELLSPANKKEESGRQAYRRKQFEYIAGRVNLVEIDLIRSGRVILAIPEGRLREDLKTPYLICVRRVQRPDEAEIIHFPLDQPVPNFRIPLRSTDADIVLQLQPLLDDCYRRGRYASIDYSQPPRPSFSPPEDAWADELLRAKGLRPTEKP